MADLVTAYCSTRWGWIQTSPELPEHLRTPDKICVRCLEFRRFSSPRSDNLSWFVTQESLDVEPVPHLQLRPSLDTRFAGPLCTPSHMHALGHQLKMGTFHCANNILQSFGGSSRKCVEVCTVYLPFSHTVQDQTWLRKGCLQDLFATQATRNICRSVMPSLFVVKNTGARNICLYSHTHYSCVKSQYPRKTCPQNLCSKYFASNSLLVHKKFFWMWTILQATALPLVSLSSRTNVVVFSMLPKNWIQTQHREDSKQLLLQESRKKLPGRFQKEQSTYVSSSFRVAELEGESCTALEQICQ